MAAERRSRSVLTGFGRAAIAVVVAITTWVGSLSVPAQAETVAFYMPGTSPTPPISQTVGVSALGAAVQGLMTTAYQIGYPASIGPFTGAGALALDYSVAQGVANLGAAIAAVPASDSVKLFGVSQGDIVLTYEEYALMAAGHSNNVTFVRLADPSGPTGILGRNAGLLLPGISCVVAPQDSPYNTINVVYQYDVFADWPAHQENLLADLNAVAGGVLFHNYWSYNVDLSTIPSSDVTTTVNSHGATTTTYFIRDNGLLPILQLAKNAGASEQVVNALQPILKPIVDGAYRPVSPNAWIAQKIFQTVVNTAVAGGVWTVNALRNTSITAASVVNTLSGVLTTAATRLQALTPAAAQKSPIAGSVDHTTTAVAAIPNAASDATKPNAAAPHGALSTTAVVKPTPVASATSNTKTPRTPAIVSSSPHAVSDTAGGARTPRAATATAGAVDPASSTSLTALTPTARRGSASVARLSSAQHSAASIAMVPSHSGLRQGGLTVTAAHGATAAEEILTRCLQQHP
ncbi:PE-PPE domain-containing protein [Mycolicibacterium aubagnense]|nr:PE-PPE domain-containing protein [Mycolicibacterium aubagnense]